MATPTERSRRRRRSLQDPSAALGPQSVGRLDQPSAEGASRSASNRALGCSPAGLAHRPPRRGARRGLPSVHWVRSLALAFVLVLTLVEAAAAAPHFPTELAEHWCGTERASDFRPGWFPQERAQVKVIYAYATDRTGQFQQYSDLIQRDVKASLELVGDESGGVSSIAFDLGTDCGPRYVDIASVALNHPSIHYTMMPTVHDRTTAIQVDLRAKLGLDRPWEHPIAYADGASTEPPADAAASLSGANDRLGLGGLRNFAVYVNIGAIPNSWTQARGDFPGCPRSGSCAPDDRPGPENIANLGGYWAWVVQDLNRLVGGHVMLHEITHNLGAVQPTAPNAGSPGHCTDGNGHDVMCPAHPPGEPPLPLSPPCYDCGKNDYFNVDPSPPPPNHLATHWNVRNSVFMCSLYPSSPGGSDGCAPTPTPEPTPDPEPDPKPCGTKHHNPPEVCGPP
jgi:hypothetical protein